MFKLELVLVARHIDETVLWNFAGALSDVLKDSGPDGIQVDKVESRIRVTEESSEPPTTM